MSIEEIIFHPIRNKAPSIDPILISVQVHIRHVRRVVLDGGAACDIIYEHCSLKLRKEIRERMKDVYTTLSEFSSEQVNPLGEVSLLIMNDNLRVRDDTFYNALHSLIPGRGQFIRNVVSKQGIKANPAKIQALTSLKRPKTIKKVQSLNEKLTELNRFLSKSTEKSLPFFKTLKGCLEKKDFTWIREAVKAFEEMKRYIEMLPTLVAPKAGENPIVYLAASKECISVVLMTERGKDQTPIKFSTNNEAEYEAVIARLRIAKEMKIEDITVFVDSQLIANQVNGFHNKKADALSKLVSLAIEHLTKKVLVEKLMKKSIYEKQVAIATAKEGTSLMTPIIEYLDSGILPADKKLERKIRVKAHNYRIIDGLLYKRSFLTLSLRCLGPKQEKNVIKEIHGGSHGLHAEPRSLVAKITTLGYYSPSMHRDSTEAI
nr:reverse transcriptase domain-containing protein [Tanacetum cinerariifolium]